MSIIFRLENKQNMLHTDPWGIGQKDGWECVVVGMSKSACNAAWMKYTVYIVNLDFFYTLLYMSLFLLPMKVSVLETILRLQLSRERRKN